MQIAREAFSIEQTDEICPVMILSPIGSSPNQLVLSYQSNPTSPFARLFPNKAASLLACFREAGTMEGILARQEVNWQDDRRVVSGKTGTVFAPMNPDRSRGWGDTDERHEDEYPRS
jgi:hypothetical protein